MACKAAAPASLALLAFGALWAVPALAEDYVVPGNLPACPTAGGWYRTNDKLYNCPRTTSNEAGVVSLADGDTLVADKIAADARLESLCGFALQGAKVGAAGAKINLAAPTGLHTGTTRAVSCPQGTAFSIDNSTLYGNIETIGFEAFHATLVARDSAIFGNVVSNMTSATPKDYRSIDFTDVAVTGSVYVTTSDNGALSLGIHLVRGSVSGSVYANSYVNWPSYNNRITADGTLINGDVAGSVITLNDSRVGGKVWARGGPITLTNTNVVGSVESLVPPVIINGGVINGAVAATFNPYTTNSVCAIEMNNVTMVSFPGSSARSVTASGSPSCTVTIRNSTLGANLTTNWSSVTSTGKVYIKDGTVVWGAVGAGLQDPMTLVEAGSMVMDFCRVYDAKGNAIISTTNPAAFGYRCGGGAGAPAPDNFNAFEPSAPKGAVTGPIYTKLADKPFALAIQALNKGAAASAFGNTVKVELLANKTPGEKYGANNCPSSFEVLQTIASVKLTGGRAVSPDFKSAKAARDVRARIATTAAPTKFYCSTDSFAIRPEGFAVSSTNAGWVGTSPDSPTKFRAGRDAFNVTVDAATPGYDGAPLFNPEALLVGDYGQVGILSGGFGQISNGKMTGDFIYSEVPGFQFAPNAVYDSDFTQIDQKDDGCVAGSFANEIDDKGRYGCNIGSAESGWFGRFIPDHFAVSLSPACASPGAAAFTYSGQGFRGFAVKAMNGLTPPAPTKNYAAATGVAKPVRLFDATGAAGSLSYTQGGVPGAPLAPTDAFADGVMNPDVFPGLAFQFAQKRSAPAVIRLRAEDADGVSSQGYDDAALAVVRAGQLQLFNAFGAAGKPIAVNLQTQYWTGDSWLLNTDDSCTALVPANFALSSQGRPTDVTAVHSVSAFSAGGATLILTPTDGQTATIDVAANLGWTGVDASCLAWHGGASGVGNPFWLRSQNGSCPAALNWASDPSASVTFGTRTRRVIHARELFR